jgi:hypothetical protein
VFDRFVARVALSFGDQVTLKGGLVLEARLQRARTTKDVDLRIDGEPGMVRAKLEAAARREMGDFMSFHLALDRERPLIQNEGMPYDGQRFRVACVLDAKPYGQPFGVDVAFGDPLLGEPDVMAAPDILGFAGIPAPQLRLYPIETHIAEKVHAYTLPRPRPNTRVKDLPDIALLGTLEALDASRLRVALAQTFAYRRTHELPVVLPGPSPLWETPYAAMASADELPWDTLVAVTEAARGFLDPVLHSQFAGVWEPRLWEWRTHE